MLIVMLIFFGLCLWIWSGLRKIPIGWKALLTFFGRRTSVEFKEGWCLALWPFGLQAKDCRQKILELDTLNVYTADKVKVGIDGKLVYQIENLFLYSGVDEKTIKEGLDAIWDENIRTTVIDRPLDNVLSMHVELSSTTQKVFETETIQQWGIKTLKVVVSEIKPDDEVNKDLELQKREQLQRIGQRVQVGHQADLIRFLSGQELLDPSKPESQDNPRGPGLSSDMAYEASLIHMDKAENKKLASNTLGVDPATVMAILEALRRK